MATKAPKISSAGISGKKTADLEHICGPRDNAHFDLQRAPFEGDTPTYQDRDKAFESHNARRRDLFTSGS